MKRSTRQVSEHNEKKRKIYNAAVPLVMTAAVAAVTYSCQTFTLLHQEGVGLFLNTPDYYRELLIDPFPISHLIGSFIVQFYSIHILGTALVTAMVLGVWYIFRAIFKRLGLGSPMPATVSSCIAWWFIAGASDPSTAVAILLLSGILLVILSIFMKTRPGPDRVRWWTVSASSIIIIGSACAIAFCPQIKETEKWSRIEFAGVQGSWDYLLKYATPEEAAKDIEIVPWALMALNIQGRMEEGLKRYPVTKEFGLDYGEGQSYRSNLFYSLLYSRLGVYNESVHKIHQSGGYLPHGTSFRTLRMLVQENYKLQDSLMVVKYCDVLDRSTLHHKFVRHFRENPCPQRAPSSFGEQGTEPVIVLTKNQMETMLQIGRAGFDSGMAMERYYCYRLLSGAE